jgi:hypothetical protein
MLSDEAPPASLAQLIELDIQPQRVWRSDELGAIVRHELSLPLQVAVGELSVGGIPPMLPTDAGINYVSLGALLHHPAPSLELLQLIKEASKAARNDSSSHLPEEVSAILYALAIAAALLRYGRKITSMTPAALRGFFSWAMQRPWIDSASRTLIRDADQRLVAAPTEQKPE